jgi:GAF domain-containing protein
MGRAFLESAPVQVEDVTTDLDYDPRTLEILQRAAPYRSYLGIPIGRPGAPIGAIGLGRRRVLPFTERQIELVTTFADQAVIAIENARLFDEVQARTKELTEALERQTATGEVLGVISRSPTDLQPVLDTIVATAARLCRAEWANIRKLEPDGKYHLAAATGNDQEFLRYLAQNPVVAGRGTMTGRTALEGRTLHIPDVLQDPEFTWSEVQAKGGHRTLLGVPLLRGGAAIGVIILARNVVRPFKEKEIELVTTFADQAVIAIENVRLFEEIEARTEELRKALEQQVATGEILRVIASSPTDIAPVLNAVAESAARLCGAADAQIFRVEDDSLRLAASFGSIPIHFRERAIGRDWVTGRAVVDRLTIHVPDLAAVSEAEFPTGREMQRRHGHRTTLATPLLRQGVALGAILIRRMDVNPFTEDQIRLLEAFADQAVIAIENVRLFTQLETRNAELNEALEQQTATAEVLKVISRYAFDLETVLRALLDSAIRLCGATRGHVFTCDGEFLRLAVAAGASPGFIEYIRDHPLRIGPGSAAGRAAAERRTTQIDDILVEPGYEYRNVMDEEGYRTVLAVPLLRNEALLGVIAILKPRVEPFTARQIELVATFADQAVIAIENARLLRELRESLEQQTATADVLKAISRATFDLPTVLKTLVEAAARLCEADQGTIAREQNGIYRRVASYGFSDQFNELISTLPVERGRGSATGRALAEGRVVHIPDVQSDPDYTFIEAKKLGGFRTILAVPMLREDVAIGVLALTRSRVCPFTEKEIELVATFADQAAIAIENVRLFESVEARTRELAESLEDLRTAQDRLVQTEKLASLGQLTAGIAHEIKNPLNFVNNFAGVSTELIEELREALAGVQLEDKAAEDVTELSQMLRGNLDKIVEHGKRADSIVKNMLLHARQGSGEHRRVDINAIVEESLNLAYHGARAERRGFNIALERSFDPTAGEVDVYPQEITRVLLNLISNGFYATLKRKAGDDDRHYEPTLKAATKNLGDRVEITIRDNGTGIPPEVREQLFRPFFTTKPVGEGTGLGLSISHDIVVKQHAGSIALDTRPGEFTEFSIVLPRDAASLAGGAPA